MRTYEFVLVAYLLIGIFTFGHSASHSADEMKENKAFNGIAAGLSWPLYWSWEIQR